MRKSGTAEPHRVLFLCTHNSARSQIAEALLSRKGRGRFHVASAGTEPAAEIHPLALRALSRAGIQWETRRPKSVDEVLEGRSWDLVITVCEKARETCPQLPGYPVPAYWGIPDPADMEGDEEIRDAAFWDTLSMLGRRIDLLCALPDEKLRGLASRTGMSDMGAEESAAATERVR